MQRKPAMLLALRNSLNRTKFTATARDFPTLLSA